MLTLIVAMRNYDHNNAMRIARWKVQEWFIQEAGKKNFEQHPVLPGDIRILKAVEFIENNFRSNIGVVDIAASASLGVVRLRTLFQQATGMSPGAYLLRFRLLFAARRLARYDVSVAEIAAESGFSSPAYFSSAFRHAFNCSPCEFRNFIRKI
jgi:AraC-like DNA-binding protein